MLQVGQLGRLDLGRHVPDLLEVPTGAIDRSMGDVHGQGNPHINHDPRRMRAILPLIAQRLTALDPANQTYYETRLALTLQSFDELLTELRTSFAQVPSRSRRVITYHRSLSYFLETLGITAIATIEPKPGIPPNPSHVANVLGQMKRKGVGTVIQEVYYPSRTGKTLAKLGRGRLIVISGGTMPNQSYVENVRRNANQILASLRKD